VSTTVRSTKARQTLVSISCKSMFNPFPHSNYKSLLEHVRINIRVTLFCKYFLYFLQLFDMNELILMKFYKVVFNIRKIIPV